MKLQQFFQKTVDLVYLFNTLGWGLTHIDLAVRNGEITLERKGGITRYKLVKGFQLHW